MDVIVDIIYAILFIWCGIAILKYRRVVKSWTGSFVWAEQYLGRGGTYFILILIWIFLIFLWVLYPFWWLELLTWWWDPMEFQPR